jgi:hypothetical protein
MDGGKSARSSIQPRRHVGLVAGVPADVHVARPGRQAQHHEPVYLENAIRAWIATLHADPKRCVLTGPQVL